MKAIVYIFQISLVYQTMKGCIKSNKSNPKFNTWVVGGTFNVKPYQNKHIQYNYLKFLVQPFSKKKQKTNKQKGIHNYTLCSKVGKV